VRRERLRDGQVSPLTILAPTDSQLGEVSEPESAASGSGSLTSYGVQP
jgi:hypothetical protein